MYLSLTILMVYHKTTLEKINFFFLLNSVFQSPSNQYLDNHHKSQFPEQYMPSFLWNNYGPVLFPTNKKNLLTHTS